MKIEKIEEITVLTAADGMLITNIDVTVFGQELWLGVNDRVENYVEVAEQNNLLNQQA